MPYACGVCVSESGGTFRLGVTEKQKTLERYAFGGLSVKNVY